MAFSELESKDFLNEESLKTAYKTFLAKLQPHIPMGHSLGIEFVDDHKKKHALIKCFNINLEREGINQLIRGDSARRYSLSQIQAHLDILNEVDFHLYSLFTLAINIVFCGDSSHAIGGTTSGAIGVVWGNPEKEWKECDYLEYFVHELTHTLMFLDELRFLHYKDQEILYDKKNFSSSAILQIERPFDRVLHSIVVAVEVLMLRGKKYFDHSKSRIHPATDQLIESTEQAINKLLAHQNRDKILTPRAIEIVKVCQDSLSQHFTLRT